MKKPKPVAAQTTPKSIVILASVGLLATLAASRLPQLLISALKLEQRLGVPVIPDLTALTAHAAILRLATLAAVLAFGFVFWSSGRVVCRILELEPSSRLESSATALALGALVWGELFFVLGLAGLLQMTLLRVLLIGGMAAGMADRLRHPPDSVAFRRELREADIPWLSLLGVHLLVLAPYAFIPETFYDALEYHLALPGLALLRGRIGPVPLNAFSGLPSIPSMLYGWTLAVDMSGRTAHLLCFGFLSATALAILGLARRLGNSRLGGPAAVLFAVAPCVVMMSVCTGVELPGAFFQTVAMSAILGAADGERTKPWVAAGLLIGAAMATKPLAWGLPAAALVAVWAAGLRRSNRGLAWATTAACVVFVPWLIKNAAFYGNPIYPFFHERFQPHAAIMPNWHYFNETTGIPWISAPWSALAVWLKAPFEAARYQHDLIQYADPILIGLLPAGIWLALRERRFKILLWFTLAAWLPVSFATDLPRYFIPIYPALALAAAAAVQSCGRILRSAVLVSLTAFGVTLWIGILPTERLRVFTGEQTESEFLAHVNGTYPGPLDPAARWINDNASADARVIVVGDARGFQLRRDYIAPTPRQITPLELWANAAIDGNALRERLLKEKVKYILINQAEILRLGIEFSFTQTGKSALKEFWGRYTRKVFQVGPDQARLANGQETLDRWSTVYEVLSDEEAAAKHESDDPFAALKPAT